MTLQRLRAFRPHLLRAMAMALLLSGSCATSDSVFSNTPEIRFVSITPSSLSVGDDVVITIAFQDGDGDLGRTGSRKNLYVRDLRPFYPYTPPSTTTPQTDTLLNAALPELAEGSDLSIKGEVQINLPSMVILPLSSGSASQTAQFEIWVFDAAGNRSNTVRTTPITITR